MQKVNFRRSFRLYGTQIIAGLLVLTLTATDVVGQQQNNPNYDNRLIHFGFTLGGNAGRFKYELSDAFYRRISDTIRKVTMRRSPGITMGAIVNMHFGQYFDFRMLPSLILSDRTVEYQMNDGSYVDRQVESAMLEFPFHIKYKSKRRQNWRFYVILGLKYGYDLSAEEDAEFQLSDGLLNIDRDNYYWEYGAGFDFYLRYFKFSPEIKVANGLNNVLRPQNHIYSNTFSSLRSSYIFLSLHFE